MTLRLLQVPLTRPEFNYGRMNWADAHAVHVAVMRLFPQIEGPQERRRETAGVLFRIESGLVGDAVALVQSQVAPVAVGLREVDLDAVLTRMPVGTPVSFRVQLNTVKRVDRDGVASRKPVPAAEVVAWAQSRLAGLEGVQILEMRPAMLRQRNVPLRTAVIDGIATVGDGAALRSSVATGVGRAKAYGCALLSVKLR